MTFCFDWSFDVMTAELGRFLQQLARLQLHACVAQGAQRKAHPAHLVVHYMPLLPYESWSPLPPRA